MIRAGALFAVASLLAGCSREEPGPERAPKASASGPGASIAAPEPLPVPKKGMAYVPQGSLVAGTPPDGYPRLADEEIPGEQIIIRGFYIDIYPYPNEEGAIPLTNVSRDEAERLCGERQKRLCGELEWERACKGPENNVYEYGERYRPEPCGTGAPPVLRPSGLRVGCRSDFGVRDLHGGAWEWTKSPWKRGAARNLWAVRGGNGPAGELVGRCANADGRPADFKAPELGFRCCAGADTAPDVEIVIMHPRRLDAREKLDVELARRLLEVLPDEARADLAGGGALEAERMWSWWPMGNDELLVMSICSGSGKKRACGAVVARVILGRPVVLAWAEAGSWEPMLDAENDPRVVWVLGGDDPGSLRRKLSYVWGKVSVGPRERRPIGRRPKAASSARAR